MDDITIGVTEFVNNISVSAQPNDQIIDITVTETVETVLLDISTTVEEVSVTATQNVIVENITVDYVNNENNIDINVTDASQDVTLNITPTLVEINILRSGGEVNILQFDSLADFPATGSSDYFYLAKDTNKLYRWTGSAYAEISATSSPIWGQIIGTLSNQTDLQNALNLKAPLESPTFTGTVSGITKTMVGLGAVDNTSDLNKPISTATQTALNAKQPLDGDLTSIAGLTGTAGFLKKNGANSWNLDNTTYLSSISSSDVTTALGYTPENAANKGVNNGYASLGGDGKVPSSQLPSYVDDVIEVANYGSLPSTGETGKIYITLDTNKIYRWTGSVYVEVSSSAAVWGAITGTLSNQTDLQSALDAKQDDLNGTGFVKASGTTISYDNTSYYPASNPNGYTTNTGTVTSVAMSVPSAFSVSGSPITSSGTLAVTATGNTTQYIAGDGSLVTFPTVGTAGTLIREVRNTTGATLTKGTVVYISGATGNKPTVSKAIATGDSTSAQTFGLVQADIANNANGNIVCVGDLTGVDTSALTEGVQLYLSSTTAGAYTTTKQYAPNHLVYIGIVTRAHPTLGQIEVKIQNGYELDELHNVAAQTPSNNDGLFYESSTSLWKNKSISTVLGYTPANGADYMALTGNQSIAGFKTFTGYAQFENGVYIKQDGTLSGITGYNTLDANTTSVIFSLPNTSSAAEFKLSNLTQLRFFDLPNASGTIALTSDIPAAYTLPTASTTVLGGVKVDGTTITINGSGVISGTASYTLPTATSSVLGGVKIGSGVTITSGVISVSTNYQAPLSGTGFVVSTAGTISYDTNTYLTTSSAASTYLPLTGGTLTGTLTSNSFLITSSQFAVKKNSSGTSSAFYGFQNSVGTNRWNLSIDNAETGSGNTGFDFNIYRYDDSGAAISSALTIKRSTGNIGIGTTTTTWKLSVANEMVVGAQGGSDYTYICGGSGYGSKVRLYYADGTLNSELSGNGNTILNSTYGNTGIGTTSPTAKLEVSGYGTANSIMTYVTAKFYGSGTGGLNIGTDGTNPMIGPDVSATSIVFLKRVSGVYSEAMRITSAGQVGIGTTDLSGVGSNLVVAQSGTPNISTIRRLDASNTGAGRLFFQATNSVGTVQNVGFIESGLESSSTAGYLMFASNTTERMRITSGGNVGINVSSPSYRLQVDGNVYFKGASSGSGDFALVVQNSSSTNYFLIRNDGLTYAQGIYNNTNSNLPNVWVNSDGSLYRSTTSSQRFKEHINDWSGSGLNTILALKPKTFKYKKDYYNLADVDFLGLIAEEVAEVSPYLAEYENQDRTGLVENVRYATIVVPLIKAVQELKAELDTLKNK